jgi:hypothetical protein
MLLAHRRHEYLGSCVPGRFGLAALSRWNGGLLRRWIGGLRDGIAVDRRNRCAGLVDIGLLRAVLVSPAPYPKHIAGGNEPSLAQPRWKQGTKDDQQHNDSNNPSRRSSKGLQKVLLPPFNGSGYAADIYDRVHG